MIPASTRLRYAQGYLELDMFEDAETELDAIEEAESESFEVLAIRVLLYQQSRSWERMESVAKHLADMEPANPLGWVHWAYALREQEKLEEAEHVASLGVVHHPEEAVLWFNLACYNSLLGRLAEAAVQLARSIEFDSQFEREAATDPDLANLRQSAQN